MFTETVWTIRDREPRMSTSTFTQHLRSDCHLVNMVLNVLRNQKFFWGAGDYIPVTTLSPLE